MFLIFSSKKSLKFAFLGIKPTAALKGEAKEVARFTADGQRISAPQRGVNIVRYSDGTVRKVWVN